MTASPSSPRTKIERAFLRGVLALPDPVLRKMVGRPRRNPDGMELDLRVQVVLGLIEVTGQTPLVRNVPAGRANMDRTGALLDPVERAPVTTRELEIPGPSVAMRARLYSPDSQRNGSKVLPLIVYFHGGGFVFGSLTSHDGVCRWLAHATDSLVIAVDYPLAPEHRFPAAPLHAIAATRWAIAQARSFGADPTRVAVAGDSAGGNLSAVVAQQCRHDAVRPALQVLIYPATDFTRSHRSHALFWEGYLLTSESIDWFIGNYLNSEREKTDPIASPLHTGDLTGVPPAIVVTGGFDPLRDEGRAYAERLRGVGALVHERCLESMIHGFVSMGLVPAARAAMDDLAERVRRALHAPTEQRDTKRDAATTEA